MDETTLISTQTSSKFSQPFQECSSSVSDVVGAFSLSLKLFLVFVILVNCTSQDVV